MSLVAMGVKIGRSSTAENTGEDEVLEPGDQLITYGTEPEPVVLQLVK